MTAGNLFASSSACLLPAWWRASIHSLRACRSTPPVHTMRLCHNTRECQVYLLVVCDLERRCVACVGALWRQRNRTAVPALRQDRPSAQARGGRGDMQLTCLAFLLLPLVQARPCQRRPSRTMVESATCRSLSRHIHLAAVPAWIQTLAATTASGFCRMSLRRQHRPIRLLLT